MKTKICSVLFASVISTAAMAQDVTTVNATSTEISDNLDLRAVASIFGESANLEDFERKLNDPELQISNLDLNNDNQVDYLRVVEMVEGSTHLIVLQSVLAKDVYQDVATIEVERDASNNVQVQVVGDVYMYGPNYIYEPVYVTRPIIFTSFWIGGYHPYVSSWYWGYYPTYYHVWQPYPIFRYRRNIHVHINVHNQYNYVNVRRSDRAYTLYQTRRADGYERQYPNRSFQQRHSNVANRYELDQKRNTRDVGVRNGLTGSNPRNAGTRTNTPRTQSGSVRGNNSVRANAGQMPRANTPNTPRNNPGVRNQSNTPRENTAIKTRDNQSVRTQIASPASNPVRTPANQSVRIQNTPRENSVRTPSAPVQQRMENTAPRAPRMQTAPANNNAQRMQPQGNANRGQKAGGQRQSQGRGGEGRR